ncbi:MAG: hypothetical protein FE834_07200, partial [Gammaproteobacteria bacterium]|nr:hypothetical protein [Gammaproteobacteria bacterium]
MKTFTHTITHPTTIMKTITLLLATLTLLLSAQSLATPNPNPNTKQFNIIFTSSHANLNYYKAVWRTPTKILPMQEIVLTDTNNDSFFGCTVDPTRSQDTTTGEHLIIYTGCTIPASKKVTAGKKMNIKTYIPNPPPTILSGYTLCIDGDCGNLAMTSTPTLEAPEGTSITHTLATNDPSATFTLLENPSNLFSLSGTTLTFTGTTTDFDDTTQPKQYTVKVKATTGSATTQNTTQEITLKLTNLNDEIPTNILITRFNGINTITENSPSIKLASFTATDRDATDTHTFTALNTTYFEIRN